MPVELAAVRLLEACGVSSPPAPALLADCFERSFARLFSTDPRYGWQALRRQVQRDPESADRLLREHLYRRMIGPWLDRERVHLAADTDRLLRFWEAVGNLCTWTAGEIRTAGEDAAQPAPPAVDVLLSPEEALQALLYQDGWREPVRLVGSADFVARVRNRERPRWIGLALTPQGAEETLLRGALMQMELAHREGAGAGGGIVRLAITPRVEEVRFTSAGMLAARQRLTALAGELAGVAPGAVPAGAGHPAAAADSDRVPHSAERLVEAFRLAGIRLEAIDAPQPGPTFVRYRMRAAEGDDKAAVRRAAVAVERELNLPRPPLVLAGEGFLTVDLERTDPNMTAFDSLEGRLPEADSVQGVSRFPAGVSPDGELRLVDLAAAESAHVLVCGSAGSGKSEWLRSVLASLVLANSPDTLRLILIDPEGDVFGDFGQSSFLIGPDAVIGPGDLPPGEILSRLVEEMDDRHRFLQDAGAADRDEFVARTGRRMPRILCVCDECSGLLAGDRPERRRVDTRLARLGEGARTAGIHLIFATRQATRRVLRGILNATLPARVGMRMTQALESRLLMGHRGCEGLAGPGDLLYRDAGPPERLHSPLLARRDRSALFGR